MGGIFILMVLFLVYSALSFNNLVTRKNKVENSWGQIDVQLRRRFDLIPNLVETVKSELEYEKEILENVVKVHSVYMMSENASDVMKANSEMTKALGKLFAVAESYPDLKTNSNFLELQKELTKIERKIGFARQFYNDAVMMYNNAVQTFPNNFFAKLFRFSRKDYFSADPEIHKTTNIKL